MLKNHEILKMVLRDFLKNISLYYLCSGKKRIEMI